MSQSQTTSIHHIMHVEYGNKALLLYDISVDMPVLLQVTTGEMTSLEQTPQASLSPAAAKTASKVGSE